MSSTGVNLHSSIVSTYEMLSCAFKDKIPEEFYEGVVLTLLQTLSVDQTVDVVAKFTDKAYMEVYLDVKNIQTPVDEGKIPHPIKMLLLPCGYTEWLSTSHTLDYFVPSYLMGTYEMLKCAFPEDISNDEQTALLSFLHSYMSKGSLVQVLSGLKNEEYVKAFKNVMSFNPETPIDASVLERVKERLVNCGYETWILEDI